MTITLEPLTYLSSLIIIGGTLVVIWYHKSKKLLKKFEWVLIGMFAFTIPYAVAESDAIRWGAWRYNTNKVLPIHLLGAQIESYILMLIVCFILVAATLSFALQEDKSRKKPRKKRA